MNEDPIGIAVSEYWRKPSSASIQVLSDLCEEDEIPVSYLFRSYDQMPYKEQLALSWTGQRISDIGAGTGAHSLYLEQAGKSCLSLDTSGGCCALMKERGLKEVIHADFFSYIPSQPVDTLLFLMNGLGLAGTLEGLGNWFRQAHRWLVPGGSIVGESTDIVYMFEEEDGSVLLDLNGRYYGEVQYQMRYKKTQGPWFPWLYLSHELLALEVEKYGFRLEKIWHGDQHDYVFMLVKC
ncbi:MAG: class I SAM-dependent methyltransferase [Cytophagaceae bacterium]|jgi:SAM-dependent methyltransferase|nr:class I SAM-dependent methyltransferase [Cytophagaceae bacterium]